MVWRKGNTKYIIVKKYTFANSFAKQKFSMSHQTLQYEKMTQTPVRKLVSRLAIPTTISMLITTIYNIVDTYFVGWLGTSAIGATGVVFALMAVIQAIGFMIGQGAGSIISRYLGSREDKQACRTASTSFAMAILLGGIIMVVGLLFCNPLMKIMGSTDTILPYARTYAIYILLAAPAIIGGSVLNNILRYEGRATYAMIGLTIGSVLNIVGDAIFIFVFDMGIAGAGLSTTISFYIGLIVLLIPFVRGKTQSRLSYKFLTTSRKVITDILFVGSPSLCRQGLNSISVMVLNLLAAKYSDSAIAAMSIVSRITMLMFCVNIGIGQGFQPVSAFNYGAGKYDRVKAALIFTWQLGTLILVVLSSLCFFFAQDIITFFRNDPEVVAIGIPALKYQCIAMVLMSFSSCGNMLFQSTGHSGTALLLSSFRSGLFFIPTILILTPLIGITGIQIAQPIADALASLCTIPFIIRFLRQIQ